MKPGHFVYIVRCADGTLYTGYARDPRARAQAHNTGRGAKYTAGRSPVVLVYTEKFRTLGRALRREHELKCLSRAMKEVLIQSAAQYSRIKKPKHGGPEARRITEPQRATAGRNGRPAARFAGVARGTS